MSNRNTNLIDTIDNYELIKTRKKHELLIRSPEGANFILDVKVAGQLVAILLFDESIKRNFLLPETLLKEELSPYEGDYSLDQASLKQDRSLLAQVDGYTILPSSLHGKDHLHLRKDGINFIISLKVLFEIVQRFSK